MVRFVFVACNLSFVCHGYIYKGVDTGGGGGGFGGLSPPQILGLAL